MEDAANGGAIIAAFSAAPGGAAMAKMPQQMKVRRAAGGLSLSVLYLFKFFRFKSALLVR